MSSPSGNGAAPVSPDPVSPDIDAFLREHGRMPFLGDAIPPWRYCGWLLCQVHLADFHPDAPGRWRHYFRILAAAKLLDEPIPQIQFAAGTPDAGSKMILRCVDLIARHESSWSAFQNLIQWLAWGLAVSSEEAHLTDPTHEALYRTFNLEPLVLEPHDYFGSILADHRSGGWNPHAFFPTPHTVVELMIEMLLGSNGDQTDHRLEKVVDPAVGTGRMLLHASNYSYCLYWCDIDPLVAMITRINGALYAPWLAFPLPERILGVELPPPPPAELPLPEEHRSPAELPTFRCDDRGQGLLFD